MIDPHDFTRGCIIKTLKRLDGSLELTPFISLEECLEGTDLPEIILYHVHGTADVYARRELEKRLLKNAAVIMLSADDSPEAVSKAFGTGARGYIPTTSTPIELVIEIIRLIKAGGTFVPPIGLSPQNVNRPRSTSTVKLDQHFTPRQLAVLELLTEGKANKIIAYELKMSESTVKVHLRNIMKRMNASNRTEVACRVREFRTAGSDLAGAVDSWPKAC
jgi:DNA-binding NarL/FixJ family response regulator